MKWAYSVILFGNDWFIFNISVNRFYYRVGTSGVILCPHNYCTTITTTTTAAAAAATAVATSATSTTFST